MKKIKFFSIALVLFCVYLLVGCKSTKVSESSALPTSFCRDFWLYYKGGPYLDNMDDVVFAFEKSYKDKFRYSDDIAYIDTNKLSFDELSSMIITLWVPHEWTPNFLSSPHKIKDFNGKEITRFVKTEAVKSYEYHYGYYFPNKNVNCTKQKVTYYRYEDIDLRKNLERKIVLSDEEYEHQIEEFEREWRFNHESEYEILHSDLRPLKEYTTVNTRWDILDFFYPKFSNPELEPLNNAISEIMKDEYSEHYRAEEDRFREGGEPNWYSVFLSKIYENDRYISLLFSTEGNIHYSGHGTHGSFSVCYDKQKKKVVNLNEYFEDNYSLPSTRKNLEKVLGDKIKYQGLREVLATPLVIYYAEDEVVNERRNSLLFYIDYKDELQVVAMEYPCISLPSFPEDKFEE